MWQRNQCQYAGRGVIVDGVAVFAGVGIAIVTGADGAGVGAVAGSFLGVCSVVQPFVEVLEVFLLLDGMVGVE